MRSKAKSEYIDPGGGELKQFIVLTAVLPVLMIFVMQTAYDQKNNYAVSLIHDMVYAAKEEAKYEGSFTREIQGRLRGSLSGALEVPENEITIVCSEDDGMIYYRVEVPVNGVMAGGRLLGIKDKDNRYKYIIDSYTRSSVISTDDDDNDEGTV